MKAKDIGALVIGSAVIILLVFYVLPVFGIEIPNPFLPSTRAYITIAPNVFLLWCEITPHFTFVDFGTPRVSVLSVLGERQANPFPSFSFSNILPEIPPEHNTVPPLAYVYPLASIPTCYGNPQGGADIGMQFKLVESGYISPTKVSWNYCCSNVLKQTFDFNYERGVLYNWVLEVWNLRTNELLYTVQGTQVFGM